MNRWSMAIAAALACGGGTLLIAGSGAAQSGPRSLPAVGGIHWARGEAPAAKPNSSPNLLYHGGPVAHGTTVQPIFWGPKWTNATFTNDKVSGLQTFYSSVGGSSYAGTNGEYTDGTGTVGTSVTLGASLFDSSTASGGSNTGTILAEVCKVIATPVANGYYPVYTDVPRGHARYCAWHSAGTCNGVTVQFGFFFALDGDAGCDPEDTSGLHSQGLAALANVSGHELSEMMTDRHLDAWYDSKGSENSDKCAWTFGTPLLTFRNGSQWKIQGNWSNNAYNRGSGYPNSSGQNGCIDGGNYK